MVPAYQPETAYRIFMRAMFNRDIATGTRVLNDDLSTEGPRSTWTIKNEVFPAPEPFCYTLAPGASCEREVYEMVKNGTAVVKDYVVVGKDEEENSTSGQGQIAGGCTRQNDVEASLGLGEQKVLVQPAVRV